MEQDHFTDSNAQFYQEFFENISEGIFFIDVLAGHRFRAFNHNPAHTKVTGYKIEDVRGKFLEEFLPKTAAEKLIGHLKACLEANTTINFDEEVEFPTGKCYMHTTLIPVRDKNGKVYRVIGIDRNITELKKTELILRESEEKYRSIIELSPDAIYIQCEGQFVFINKAALKLFGATSEDQLIGKYFIDFVHQDYKDIVRERVKHLKDFKAHVPLLEEKYLQIDGSAIDVEVAASHIMFDNKFGALVLVRDISERKKAERALRESEAIFSSFMQYSPIYTFFKDKDLRPIALSKNYEQMLGMPIDKMLGKTMDELFPSDLAKQMIEDDKKVLKEGKPIEVIEELNGRIYSTIKFPIHKENEPLMLAGYTIDITDEKLKEQAIKASEARFRAVLENSQDIIFQWNIQTNNFDYLSPAVTKLLGYTLEELLTLSVDTLINYLHPDDISHVMDVINHASSENIDNFNLEYRCLCSDGQYRWMNILSSVVKDDKGRRLYCIGSIRDITEHKEILEQLSQAKEKAEASDRLKSAFLANMSHEIRTPLNAIMGFADLLGSSDMTIEKQLKYAQIIQQRGNDLLNLISDILVISKIEAGQMDIVESPTDLSVLLEETYQFFNDQNKLIEKKPIEFEYSCKLDQNQRFVLIDSNRTKQILINLLTNSFKFTDSGTIEFGCHLKDSNQLLFHVRDTGIGIPNDKLEIIFERFSQLNNTYLNAQKGGTGLGLSICKGLLELMDGEIWVESQVNIGTTFYFTLPYKPDLSPPKVPEKLRNTLYNWPDKTIVVVEDDRFNAEYLVECLTKTKVKCKLATDGKSALNLFYSLPSIDLILMDIQLPDINGYDLTTQIKRQNSTIIIIAQTAYASENEKFKCFESGCDDYITKPINREILLQMIQKHFDNPLNDKSLKTKKTTH